MKLFFFSYQLNLKGPRVRKGVLQSLFRNRAVSQGRGAYILVHGPPESYLPSRVFRAFHGPIVWRRRKHSRTMGRHCSAMPDKGTTMYVLEQTLLSIPLRPLSSFISSMGKFNGHGEDHKETPLPRSDIDIALVGSSSTQWYRSGSSSVNRQGYVRSEKRQTSARRVLTVVGSGGTQEHQSRAMGRKERARLPRQCDVAVEGGRGRGRAHVQPNH